MLRLDFSQEGCLGRKSSGPLEGRAHAFKAKYDPAANPHLQDATSKASQDVGIQCLLEEVPC